MSNNFKKILNAILFAVAFLIVFYSYLFNLGIMRVFLFPVFFIYSAIITLVHLRYVLGDKLFNSTNLKTYYIGLVSFMLFHLFFPDSSDNGTNYQFFGMIDPAIDSLSFIALMGVIVNLICIIKVGISKKTS